MNIKDEFMEHLRNEEGLTTGVRPPAILILPQKLLKEEAETHPHQRAHSGLSKKQLETLLELLYQNQIISNHDVDSMVSSTSGMQKIRGVTVP